ncbi:hypothetical protein TGAMA5MH_03568 [Trichoderma gamsii]|uniref:Uncharacterized protein n=1 Tax=Trichoderma gamsii TaxID=398673 RepID=A0A2K0TGW0_9HYPO|nr:hypothetical protein TGAMA5MH_03568 [Trichoderma gamsii]
MPRQRKTTRPSQRELPFSELKAEIPDAGFEEGFSLLYSEINKFIKNGIGKKAVTSKKSLWTERHSKEFLSFAGMIAWPGADGGWDKLLRSRPYRCALLSGVMMMVLDKHVFSDLLFGAGPEHAEVLRIEDSSMVNVEGFKRTDLRAKTNRVYLEAMGGIPPLFWKRVDKITAQIVAMLSPLYSAIGEDAPSQTSYQALHNIVALAGWLNVAIRLSPKITVFEWVQPGEAYQFSYLCIGEEKKMTSNGLSEAQDDQIRKRTRVMISAVPKITRYARGSDGFSAGTETYDVMEPHVVTYRGIYADWEESRVVPLQSHARNGFLVFLGRVLSLLISVMRLTMVLFIAGVFGLVIFGAWISITGGSGDSSSLPWVIQVALWPIQLTIQSLMLSARMVLRNSQVRTDYSLVSTNSWLLNL